MYYVKTPETVFRGLGSISGPSPRQNASLARADRRGQAAAAMKVVPPSPASIEVGFITSEMASAGGEVERADMGILPSRASTDLSTFLD